MRNYKSSYLKPYIRLRRESDLNKFDRYDIFTSIEIYDAKYVLAIRGSNFILEVGNSKLEIKRKIWSIKNNKAFNNWCNNKKKIFQRG